MTEEATIYRDGTTPVVSPDGSRLLARRPGRELFPASWLGRNVRIGYDGGSAGNALGTRPEKDLSGVLLEWCGAGLIVQANGSKNLLPWERVVLVQLMES
jgi:hypothetical protein